MARRVIDNIHQGDMILLHDGTFDSRWKDIEATQPIDVGGGKHVQCLCFKVFTLLIAGVIK